MSKFIFAECPCGETLRAWPHQAGSSIRCWKCRREVVVPHPDTRGRLAGALADALSDVLGPMTALAILAGAVVTSAVLLIPRAGPVLALALIAAASIWGYGRQAAAGVPESAPGAGPAPGPSDEVEAETPRPRWGTWVVRAVLALVAAGALAAPQVVRNRGYLLPPAATSSGLLTLMAAAFAGWLVVPVALLAVYAHDGRAPWRALAALARHPLATAAALAILPLGLLATEALAAALAWEQGQLPLMVADLFPPPRVEQRPDGVHLVFNYDGARADVNCSDSFDRLVPLYIRGLGRGFALTGTVPASLSRGTRTRQALWMYKVPPGRYLATRFLLTILIAWVAGVLLTVQARWLGTIAVLGSRSPPPALVPARPGPPASGGGGPAP